MGVSQIILKVGQPKIISAQRFKQEILMTFFPHNMPNWYKFAEKYGRYVEVLNAI